MAYDRVNFVHFLNVCLQRDDDSGVYQCFDPYHAEGGHIIAAVSTCPDGIYPHGVDHPGDCRTGSVIAFSRGCTGQGVDLNRRGGRMTRCWRRSHRSPHRVYAGRWR